MRRNLLHLSLVRRYFSVYVVLVGCNTIQFKYISSKAPHLTSCTAHLILYSTSSAPAVYHARLLLLLLHKCSQAHLHLQSKKRKKKKKRIGFTVNHRICIRYRKGVNECMCYHYTQSFLHLYIYIYIKALFFFHFHF